MLDPERVDERRPRERAQDLIGDAAVDITDELVIESDQVELSGELIERIGLSAADAGDPSALGLVIVMREG